MSEFQEVHQDTQTKILQMMTKLTESAHRIDNMEQDTISTTKILKTVTNQLKQPLKDYRTRVEVMDTTVDFLRNKLMTIQQENVSQIHKIVENALKNIGKSMEMKDTHIIHAVTT